MVKTASTMLPLGTTAPAFSLPDTSGKTVSLADFAQGKGFVVIFMCNHCPFVIHIRDELVKFAKEYQKKGIGVVAINSNDVAHYPDDSPARMAEDARKYGYTFPYLNDETQEVAQAYTAACTPDIFLFNQDRKLVYRGQFDSSRPESGIPVTGTDLRAACDALLAGKPVSDKQRASIGCNIKWKSGGAPAYYTGQPAV